MQNFLLQGLQTMFKMWEMIENALKEERWKLTMKRNIETMERRADLFKRFWKLK